MSPASTEGARVVSNRRQTVNYPRKLFYPIRDVAEITGLEPYVLRYWESEFDELAPEKNRGGQRRYRQRDIDLILRIKQLVYEEKYTLAGARQRIKMDRRRATRDEQTEAIDPSVLRDIRAEIEDLLRHLGA